MEMKFNQIIKQPIICQSNLNATETFDLTAFVRFSSNMQLVGEASKSINVFNQFRDNNSVKEEAVDLIFRGHECVVLWRDTDQWPQRSVSVSASSTGPFYLPSCIKSSRITVLKELWNLFRHLKPLKQLVSASPITETHTGQRPSWITRTHTTSASHTNTHTVKRIATCPFSTS